MAATNRPAVRPALDNKVKIDMNQIPKSSLDVLARSLLNFCEVHPEVVADANRKIAERRQNA